MEATGVFEAKWESLFGSHLLHHLDKDLVVEVSYQEGIVHGERTSPRGF